MEISLIISGYGGQGVLLAGTVLANAAMIEGLNITWLPSYGAEMRGGTVSCTISFSKKEVASIYVDQPDNVLALNPDSAHKYESKIKKNGRLIINSSLVKGKEERDNISYEYVPISEIADEVGESKTANMVAIGAFVALTKIVKLENVKKAVRKIMSAKKSKFLDVNIKALQKGYDFCKSTLNAGLQTVSSFSSCEKIVLK